jgi:hypothetical protein
MRPILAARHRRDAAIQAARNEYERERRKLLMAMQEKIDAAERQFIDDAFQGLREPVRRAA